MRYDFNAFTLDTDARQLSIAGRAIHISAKAFDLLCFLIEQRPRAVDKREIFDRLWPDTFVSDANLPVIIREIRSALGSARSAIRTVHRFGYSFAANVREGRVPGTRELASFHFLLHAEREYGLAQGENVVGRDPGADVFIPSSSVSRRHAVITTDGEAATVTDLKSKNGTWLDGVMITAPAPLHSGCVVGFGAIEMIYRCAFPQMDTKTLKP